MPETGDKMKDPEFMELKRRFLLGIGIIVLFAIPSFFIIHNKLLTPQSTILEKIQKEESITLLIIQKKCADCKEVQKQLKKAKIDYLSLNQDTDKNYQKILRVLNINPKEIHPPTIVRIQEGKTTSIFQDMDEEELELYIKNYQLENQ